MKTIGFGRLEETRPSVEPENWEGLCDFIAVEKDRFDEAAARMKEALAHYKQRATEIENELTKEETR